jgi:hypothetical protein
MKLEKGMGAIRNPLSAIRYPLSEGYVLGERDATVHRRVVAIWMQRATEDTVGDYGKLDLWKRAHQLTMNDLPGNSPLPN